jgi:hypothetical protein
MIGMGAVIALCRRQFVVALLALSLSPLIFYRNAFPYYYVVMLAPVSVLAGYGIEELWKLVRQRASATAAGSLVAALWIGLLVAGLRSAPLLAFDDQVLQRQIVAAAHQIFPDPVSYIDRCGMISSFRKANFFMSTWGMENYRARGEAFMPVTLQKDQPAFVLSNTESLNPRNGGRYGLLPEDRESLGRFYIGYWGPIRVAGAHAVVESQNPQTMPVPFAGDYRILTARPVLLNGAVHSNGDVIAVPAQGATIARMPEDADWSIPVVLVLASARPPPAIEPAPGPLFRGL